MAEYRYRQSVKVDFCVRYKGEKKEFSVEFTEEGTKRFEPRFKQIKVLENEHLELQIDYFIMLPPTATSKLTKVHMTLQLESLVVRDTEDLLVDQFYLVGGVTIYDLNQSLLKPIHVTPIATDPVDIKVRNSLSLTPMPRYFLYPPFFQAEVNSNSYVVIGLKAMESDSKSRFNAPYAASLIGGALSIVGALAVLSGQGATAIVVGGIIGTVTNVLSAAGGTLDDDDELGRYQDAFLIDDKNKELPRSDEIDWKLVHQGGLISGNWDYTLKLKYEYKSRWLE
ncbi:hypothetical protein Q5692_08200 [Microcoleus sp. C2C3]|uniref:hypothetical protein n=1 Tax=unclassified Microcoleus TaxID=2642155 RepID=UPI002FD28053